MYIPQNQLENLKYLVQPGKVIVIYGARRVGKTTLLHKFVENLDKEAVLFVNGDDITVMADKTTCGSSHTIMILYQVVGIISAIGIMTDNTLTTA